MTFTPKPKPLLDSLMEKVEVDENGCWLFRGATNHQGYGKLSRNRRPISAHRVAYIELVGPIPDKMVLDHLCRVRNCVNPAHLEPVTNKENILRGTGFSARKAAQTHCVNGHELTGENVYIWRTSRLCRTCRSEYRKTPERKAKYAAYDKARWAAKSRKETPNV